MSEFPVRFPIEVEEEQALRDIQRVAREFDNLGRQANQANAQMARSFSGPTGAMRDYGREQQAIIRRNTELDRSNMNAARSLVSSGQSLRQVGLAAAGVGTSFIALTNIFDNVRRSSVSVDQANQRLARSQLTVRDAVDAFAKSLDKAEGVSDRVADAMREYQAAVLKSGANSQAARDAFEELNKAIAASGGLTGDAKEAFDRLGIAQEQVQINTDKAKLAQNQYNQALQTSVVGIIPTSITATSSLVELYKVLRTALFGAKEAQVALNAAMATGAVAGAAAGVAPALGKAAGIFIPGFGGRGGRPSVIAAPGQLPIRPGVLETIGGAIQVAPAVGGRAVPFPMVEIATGKAGKQLLQTAGAFALPAGTAGAIQAGVGATGKLVIPEQIIQKGFGVLPKQMQRQLAARLTSLGINPASLSVVDQARFVILHETGHLVDPRTLIPGFPRGALEQGADVFARQILPGMQQQGFGFIAQPGQHIPLGQQPGRIMGGLRGFGGFLGTANLIAGGLVAGGVGANLLAGQLLGSEDTTMSFMRLLGIRREEQLAKTDPLRAGFRGVAGGILGIMGIDPKRQILEKLQRETQLTEERLQSLAEAVEQDEELTRLVSKAPVEILKVKERVKLLLQQLQKAAEATEGIEDIGFEGPLPRITGPEGGTIETRRVLPTQIGPISSEVNVTMDIENFHADDLAQGRQVAADLGRILARDARLRVIDPFAGTVQS